VYRGDVMDRARMSGERIAAEADLATGGPARRTQKSLKSRAEEAAGIEKEPRLIEAGGGKRPVVETAATEGKPKLIEAGGGRRPTAAEAKVAYESAQEEQAAPDGAVAEAKASAAPTGAAGDAVAPVAKSSAPAEDTETAAPTAAESAAPEATQEGTAQADQAAPEASAEEEE